jgi:uncharacterized repeat protein (TIGR03803 family)
MKTLLCTAVIVLSCSFAFGQQYKVLWSFGGGPTDGEYPVSSLVFDRAGNLYGTTEGGGTSSACGFGGCGTLFQLAPNSDGTWNETVLYSFCTSYSSFFCLDGAYPRAGLVLDAAGNLYGTTQGGGSQSSCESGQNGCGTVFELSPPSSRGGSWTETVLHNFCIEGLGDQCLDGSSPVSQLTLDTSGNVYGTASTGGNGHSNGGTVFELSRGAGGWAETVLYNFCSRGQGAFCPDGSFPQAGVTFDKSGNLYGTTQLGGALHSQGAGTVYKFSDGPNGWTETVLGIVNPSFFEAPLGTVSVDPLGNLYSTFSLGGQSGDGGVFRLVPHGHGSQFSFNGNNGDGPTAGVFLDLKRSALYGTTSGGASFFGTVFKIAAPEQLTVLYSFCSQPNCADGSGPFASLIEDESGNLYGTTKFGGANNLGVVFEIVQSPSGQKASQDLPVWRTILPSKN